MNFPEQQSLFIDSNPIHTTIKPVNVASVPQRSPFRYPGGKTWFVPTFRRWVQSLSFKPDLLIEPFAGGGIISLTALFENLVEKVVMIEKDSEVAAVWEAVMAGHTEWLADRILHFDLSHENLAKELKTLPTNVKEKAFQTILKNRTLHGGILAEGSGLLKNGENGKGIRSRWYPQTLAKRVLNLNVVKERMFFFKADALEMLPNYAENNRAIFFRGCLEKIIHGIIIHKYDQNQLWRIICTIAICLIKNGQLSSTILNPKIHEEMLISTLKNLL